MFRTALRNVLAHQARLLMTVLAVLLGVAFVCGTLVFTDTVSAAMRDSSAHAFTHVDVAVTAEGREDRGARLGRELPLTEELRRTAATTPGAAGARGEVRGFTALSGRDGKLVGDGFSTEGGNYSGAQDPRYPLTSGRAPHGAGEVALDADTARRTGYRVGDRLPLSVEGPVLRPEISGIFTTDDGSVASGGSLTLFDTATAQRLFHKGAGYDEIQVTARPGVSQTALRAALDAALPEGARTETGAALAGRQAADIDAGMSGMRTGMLAFAGIALFTGVFIIANTFTMLVAQRTKELALLRAVGASRRQVTRSVLIEALCVGLAASLVGLGAGIGLGAGLRALMGTFDLSVPDGPLVVTDGTVVSALLVGVVVTVLAAWLPARKAAKIPPVAAMSSVHASASARSLVVRNTLGALLCAAGLAGVLAGTTLSFGAGQAPMALGAALLVTGIFVLTPLLSRPMVAAAGPLLRLFGVAGHLARRNSVRNPRRTAATASALMIGLTLITGMTVIAGSMQQSIANMAAGALKADYVVSMAGGTALSPDVVEKLGAVDGVEATSPLRTAPARIDGHTRELTGVDGSTVGELTDLTLTEGTSKVGGGRVVVDADTARRAHWKPGSRVSAAFEDGRRESLTVSGVYEGNDLISGILMDTARLTPHLERPADTAVLVKTGGGASEAAKDRLRGALGDSPAVLVEDRQDVSDSIARIFTLMLNMLYGLLAMAVIVAVLGVVNTLAMSVFERSQEIGMLRAIGLDRAGVKRMVRIESLVIALFGGVLGIGLGLFFGWAAGELISGKVATYELVVPWGRMGVFLLLAAAVGVLASLWPARRAARLRMLSAISAD